mgnify:CR=1 FL=1
MNVGYGTNVGENMNKEVDANKGIEATMVSLRRRRRRTKKPNAHKKEGKFLTLNVC